MFTRYALKMSMLRTFFFPRAIDQPMSWSKFSCDLQNHLSCILSFPYHPSHHLHLLPSFTSRLSASIMLIAQIFNHPTWTPTWLPPSAEPKQFIIFTFPVQKCKVHSLWNYRGVEHFFYILCFCCCCCGLWITWVRVSNVMVSYLKSSGNVNKRKIYVCTPLRSSNAIIINKCHAH